MDMANTPLSTGMERTMVMFSRSRSSTSTSHHHPWRIRLRTIIKVHGIRPRMVRHLTTVRGSNPTLLFFLHGSLVILYILISFALPFFCIHYFCETSVLCTFNRVHFCLTYFLLVCYFYVSFIALRRIWRCIYDLYHLDCKSKALSTSNRAFDEPLNRRSCDSI